MEIFRISLPGSGNRPNGRLIESIPVTFPLSIAKWSFPVPHPSSSAVMRKTVIILKHIINSLFWLLLVVYLALMTLTKIPVVQEKMGCEIGRLLSQQLDTQVSIGKVTIGLFNRLVIDQLEMKDQQGKKLISVRRAAVRADLYHIITDGKIVINTAQLFGADIHIVKPSADHATNIQFILDKFASKEEKESKPLEMQIGSFIMRQCSVYYDRLDVPPTEQRFNPNHLAATDLSAYIKLRSFCKDSIHVEVRRLAFKEKSGVELKRLAFGLTAGLKGVELRHFALSLPHTEFQIPMISVRYQMKPQANLLQNFSIEPASLYYQGAISPSSVTLCDVSAFLPAVRLFDEYLNLSAQFDGNYDTFHMRKLNIGSEKGDLDIDASAVVSGWRRNKMLTWEAHLEKMNLSAQTVVFLIDNLKGTTIAIPEMISRLGDIHLQGTAHSTASLLCQASLQVKSQAGNLLIDGKMDRNKAFGLNLKVPAFNLSNLMDETAPVGAISAVVEAHGLLRGKEQSDIRFKADIKQLECLKYNYQKILLQGQYAQQQLKASVDMDDVHGKLHIDTSLYPFGQQQMLAVKGVVSQLSPQSLHLSDKWGDARFSANLDVELDQLDINKASGHVTVSNFVMESSEDSPYHFDQLELAMGRDEEEGHFLTLYSDFAEMELRGKYQFETIAASLLHQVLDKMPTLPWLHASEARPDNDFYLWANVNRSDWINHLLQVPLTLRQPATISCKMNDSLGVMALHVLLPDFDYQENSYRQASVNVYCPGDSLHLDSQIERMEKDGESTKLLLWGNAADNHLNTSVAWRNGKDARNQGQMNLRSRFYPNEEGKQTAEIQLLPSAFTIGEAKWEIKPALITYSDQQLDINHFALTHQDQHLLINGRVSNSDNDSIKLSLSGIDVDYVLNLVNFKSVEFGGKASGDAYLKNPFKQLSAHAQLQVDEFTFEHGEMGTLHANVDWNQEQRRIDIDAVADDGQEAKTLINGYVEPSPGHIDLAIKAEGTKLEFMQSFTSSFTEYVRGHAEGAVRLLGPLSEINLVGQLVVNGETMIRQLGCKYELVNDTVNLIPDEIELKRVAIRDSKGNKGTLSGFIHHKHLTRLSYDLDVEADRMLVYDMSDFGDDTFYGTIYGSGKVDIHGKSGELVMNVNLTPYRHSTFVYNVSSPDAISDQSFITWGSAQLNDQADSVQSYRRKVAIDEMLKELPSDVYINFLINCTPDLTLKLLMDANTNDYITLEGSGVVRATYYNKGAFNMYGTYRVQNGTYGITIQDILKKNFLFNEGGTIVFGGNPYDANLSLQAVHTVNGVSLSDLNIGNSFSNSNTTRVNCLMNITGQPRDPKIDFDLDLPTVSSDEKQLIRNIINSEEEMNQQVVYLLGIGRFYPQGANNAGMENENQQSQTSLAMQSFLSGTISSQMNSILNSVIKSNNWNFGANISTGNEGWNNAEYEGLLSGRLLNNRLLINGQFGYRDNAATSNSSFIGDFDVRYLLVPNGNLALKVYNQTNDKYFTRSSLNTQGVGIIMKKDFTNLSDLFFGTKKRKRKPAKETK